MSAKPRPCPASSTTDPPQDCDMPFCGCDPAWHVALDALVESGGLMPREARELRTSHDALVAAVRGLAANITDDMLETLRSEWGNTNVACIKHWQEQARAALKLAEESTTG